MKLARISVLLQSLLCNPSCKFLLKSFLAHGVQFSILHVSLVLVVEMALQVFILLTCSLCHGGRKERIRCHCFLLILLCEPINPIAHSSLVELLIQSSFVVQLILPKLPSLLLCLNLINFSIVIDDCLPLINDSFLVFRIPLLISLL